MADKFLFPKFSHLHYFIRENLDKKYDRGIEWKKRTNRIHPANNYICSLFVLKFFLFVEPKAFYSIIIFLFVPFFVQKNRDSISTARKEILNND